MVHKKDNLTGVRDKSERTETVSGALTGMLPLVPLWIGLALLLGDTFPSLQLPWWAIALAGLLLSAALLALRGTAIQRWVMLGGLVLTVLFCLLFRKTFFPDSELWSTMF